MHCYLWQTKQREIMAGQFTQHFLAFHVIYLPEISCQERTIYSQTSRQIGHRITLQPRGLVAGRDFRRALLHGQVSRILHSFRLCPKGNLFSAICQPAICTTAAAISTCGYLRACKANVRTSSVRCAQINCHVSGESIAISLFFTICKQGGIFLLLR